MGTGSAFKRRDVVQTFLKRVACISNRLCSILLYSVLFCSALLFCRSLLPCTSTLLFCFCSLTPLFYLPLLLHCYAPFFHDAPPLYSATPLYCILFHSVLFYVVLFYFAVTYPTLPCPSPTPLLLCSALLSSTLHYPTL